MGKQRVKRKTFQRVLQNVPAFRVPFSKTQA